MAEVSFPVIVYIVNGSSPPNRLDYVKFKR